MGKERFYIGKFLLVPIYRSLLKLASASRNTGFSEITSYSMFRDFTSEGVLALHFFLLKYIL